MLTNYLENNECSYGCLEMRTSHASANVFMIFHIISYIILLVLTQFHLDCRVTQWISLS